MYITLTCQHLNMNLQRFLQIIVFSGGGALIISCRIKGRICNDQSAFFGDIKQHLVLNLDVLHFSVIEQRGVVPPLDLPL